MWLTRVIAIIAEEATAKEATTPCMARIDLYLKVELDIDDKERPERVGAEICRVIQRIYGVRKAEVSAMHEKED